MTELHLPWLEICVVLPLVGALWVGRIKDSNLARLHCLFFMLLTFTFALGTWLDFVAMRASEAQDRFHLTSRLFDREIFQIDELSAPLLPLTALLFALTTIATVRAKARRFSFSWTLLSAAITLATFSCKEPWLIIVLLSLATIPPFLELRARGRSAGMYVAHMGLFIALMVIGWGVVQSEGTDLKVHSLWAVLPLLGAVFIRCGIAPFHCWVTDLFEKATFGTAILYVTPLAGVYAAARLVLPIAPAEVMRTMGLISLFTAVYAGAMALVQTDARRLFCYLFLSHAAVILVGLEMVTVQGLTGALCVWISVGLSLTGLGLTMRAIEARHGRLQLNQYHGLYEHMPMLAVCFMLMGLSSVGFPGTMGYVGAELLVDGAVETYPFVGVAVVLAAALNGIAIVHAYFLLFTGKRHITSVSLRMGRREKVALLTLVTLLLAGGIAPQLNIGARHHAAEELLKQRGPLIETEHDHANSPWWAPRLIAPQTASEHPLPMPVSNEQD
ncbi:NAD(P)H-quinone oxidoreductase chain 4 1 [Anatilimnocola aggregata]|uniref:NAD(P)H-quinone oxidoreductase chain 4 1 n=1 Tax=Anatilimnocola aggregata TaxID=2528021 RepID=A0A517Y4V2_9BACT|nr:proton-conducting transporter membrane subunit [Anatilimnocola aggregata]QDU25273.1 NAD(P)H-quinone oxidoreductase chain 4 1 [Anatilimnocola aggregata]